MIQGRNKFLTFSYDDGVTQDKRLVKIFNKYHLKATFNINSSLLGKPGYLRREDGSLTVPPEKNNFINTLKAA